MSSRDVAEAVFDESIEVGLMRPMPLPEGLVATELFSEPLVAVINASHPLAQGNEQGLYMEALAHEPFVFFPRSYGSGLHAQLLSLARQAGFSPHFAQEAGEAMTIIGLVSAGLGCRYCRRRSSACASTGWSIAHCWTRARSRRYGLSSASSADRPWPVPLPSC